MAHYSAIRYSPETAPAITRGIASIRWAKMSKIQGRETPSPIVQKAIRYPDKSFAIKKIK